MQGLCPIGNITLKSGVELAQVEVAYVAYGTLNAQGDNAILVCHGYTAGPSMLAHGSDAGEGSWAPLIGPGKPLDTDRYFIVCANMLGSAYGTTGPASINPHTGRRYGMAFPDITFSDIVDTQYRLLRRLGVERLRCVVGPSFGGFQALQWALDHPDMVETIGAIVAGGQMPASPGMTLTSLLPALAADPGWENGHYQDPQAMRAALTALRIDTLNTYGMRAVLQAAGHDAQACTPIIGTMAAQWAASFDACSLVVLLKAGLAFDVRARLPDIRADVLFVMASSDVLFPPDPEVLAAFSRLHGRHRAAHVMVMDTPFGHQASGPAHALWRHALVDLLESA